MDKVALCIILLFLCSCSSKNTGKRSYDLVETDTKIEFKLDDQTTNNTGCTRIYRDKNDGIEYLVFQNGINPRLLFYNMKTGEFIKDVKYTLLGPEGVSKFAGFYIKSKDEIYLNDMSFKHLDVVDWNGRLKRRIPSKSVEGKRLFIFLNEDDLIMVGDSLFLGLGINWENGMDNKLKNSPLCAVLNAKNDEIKTLPFSYFDLTQKEDDGYIVIYNLCCFDGERFIYSFPESDDIFVSDISHEHVKRIRIENKYWPHREIPLQRINSKTRLQQLEAGENASIYYDPYRDVYYRVIYPPCEIDPKINLSDFIGYGRSKFVIQVLDKTFHIIGEKEMPENIYCSMPFLIREDGVYLSESHFLNPNFDEDKLVLRRFELVSGK